MGHCSCTCAKGVGQGCGHVAALLYQIANYKTLGKSAVPCDIAKTSLPEKFRMPRGPKISGEEVQNISCHGYSKTMSLLTVSERQGIKSTLYNPIKGEFPNLELLGAALEDCQPTFLSIPSLKQYNTIPKVHTKFGMFPKGSALATRQKLHENFLMNIYDGIEYPNLPIENFMDSTLDVVLIRHEMLLLEDLSLNLAQSAQFESQTRLQGDSQLWHSLRENRITASKIHAVYARQRNFDTLVTQLKSTRRVQTKAMKEGIQNEPKAAIIYSQTIQGMANIYPCGIIINPWACWLAASPDRKVYFPDRTPPFGLLEIKCPQADSVLEIKYLIKEGQQLTLNPRHAYYTQMQTQMAVCGVHWCDFFVWCKNDYHLETIHFDPVFWADVKEKVDDFYFSYFIKYVSTSD